LNHNNPAPSGKYEFESLSERMTNKKTLFRKYNLRPKNKWDLFGTKKKLQYNAM